MSLQVRVVGAIAVLLVLSLLAGAAMLSLHAHDLVTLEVRTAFNGAVQSVGDTLRSDVEHTVTLRQVVASFQGQRHVRAALVNEKGKVIVQSQIARLAAPAPDWFARAMAPRTLTARIPIALPQYPCVVVLTSDPRSEIAEVWGHVRDAFITMLLFCGATMIAVLLAVAAAARFLRRFQAALLAIAQGSYAARLDESGPPEFAELARGFNHMAGKLSSLSRTNRQLYAQLQTTQEEERTGIARDLHDEVGPYLFAIQVDAKAVGKIGTPEAQRLSRSVREAVGHIQQHVRAILRQLRPVTQLEFGLEPAIADLAAFWTRRHPDIQVVHDIRLEGALPRAHEETAYRIVQESVSNAVRHGRPTRIAIAIHATPAALAVTVEDDGGGVTDQVSAEFSLAGAGIAGMRERIAALKGRFEIDEAGGGVRITAILPLASELVPA
jgi:two-component system sensor histidine kinase UhpB